jgi:hypothetical protein
MTGIRFPAAAEASSQILSRQAVICTKPFDGFFSGVKKPELKFHQHLYIVGLCLYLTGNITAVYGNFWFLQ